MTPQGLVTRSENMTTAYQIIAFENGATAEWIWGSITKVHAVGDIAIVESVIERDNTPRFHPYLLVGDEAVNSNTFWHSLDRAVAHAEAARENSADFQVGFWKLIH